MAETSDQLAKRLGIEDAKQINAMRTIRTSEGMYISQISINGQAGWHNVDATLSETERGAEDSMYRFMTGDDSDIPEGNIVGHSNEDGFVVDGQRSFSTDPTLNLPDQTPGADEGIVHGWDQGGGDGQE